MIPVSIQPAPGPDSGCSCAGRAQSPFGGGAAAERVRRWGDGWVPRGSAVPARLALPGDGCSGRRGAISPLRFISFGLRLGIDARLENEGETRPGLPGCFSWRFWHKLDRGKSWEQNPGALGWWRGPNPVAGTGPVPPVPPCPLGTSATACSRASARPCKTAVCFFHGDFLPS